MSLLPAPDPSSTACAGPTLTSHVVFATMTSNTPELRQGLQVVFDSWAADLLKAGAFFAVGDRSFAEEPMQDVLPASLCKDGTVDGRSCKLADVFVEAWSRDVDWLVFAHTDMYVKASSWQQALSAHSAAEPVVLAPSYGCSIATGAPGVKHGCGELGANKGICGGRPYAVSRGALQQLMANGAVGAAVFDPHTSYLPSRAGCELPPLYLAVC